MVHLEFCYPYSFPSTLRSESNLYQMTRVTAMLFTLLLFGGSFNALSQQTQPNIIFIISDSHRAEALGVAGNPFVQTPHLDRLAKKGTMFENAYVTTAICTGSRASLFSGQYMSRHGIEDFATNFSEEALAETFPLVLKKAGYQTGLIGTWGIGNKPPEAHFDHWESEIPWRTPEGVHQTDHIVKKALDYLEGYQAEAPFFLSLGFSAAHEIDPFEGNPATYEVQRSEERRVGQEVRSRTAPTLAKCYSIVTR